VSHWDPFLRSIEPFQEKYEPPPKSGMSLLHKLLFATMGLGFFLFVFSKPLFETDIGALVGLIFAFGSGGILSLIKKDGLSKAQIAERIFVSELGQRLGWSYRLVHPEERAYVKKPKGKSTVARDVIEKAAQAIFGENRPDLTISEQQIDTLANTKFRSDHARAQLTFDDPFVFPLLTHLTNFLGPSAGSPLPLMPSGLFWSTTERGVPFFLALALKEVDLRFGGKEATQVGSNQARGVQFLIAYPLDRDTGLDATLTREPIGRDSRNDLKLASVAFNKTFKIKINEDGCDPGINPRLALTRALTPATQTALLDAQDRFKLEVYLRRDVVFAKGLAFVNSKYPSGLHEAVEDVLGTFVGSALSFKRYVE